MNVIDIVLSIFLLLGFVRGFYKGFLIELAGLVALIAGIFGAIHFSEITLGFLQTFISWEEQYLTLIAFAITFIIIVLIISIIGKILTKMVNLVALGIVNRILGAVFGLLKMAFLASVFFMFFNQADLFAFDEETTQDSVLYNPVEKLAPMILPTILREVREGEIFKIPSEENY